MQPWVIDRQLGTRLRWEANVCLSNVSSGTSSVALPQKPPSSSPHSYTSLGPSHISISRRRTGPVSECSSALSWLLQRSVLPPSIFESHQRSDRILSQYTNDSTLRNVHWALATGVFGKKDVNRIEREFLEVLAWQLSFTEQDILAHYGAIVNLYFNPPKQSSNTPPSLSPHPSPTTAPSVRYPHPKDSSTPTHNSATSYDLSSPPLLLYPVALATQPFILKAQEAKHSRPSGFTGFPLPWHGKNHSMPGQHTLPRISV